MNSVSLYGYLCADPEYREYKTRDGKKGICSRFTIGIYRDADHSDFIGCTAFGYAAEFAVKLHKGDSVTVHGKWRTDKVEDNKGQVRYYQYCMCDTVESDRRNVSRETSRKKANKKNSRDYREEERNIDRRGEWTRPDDNLPFNDDGGI